MPQHRLGPRRAAGGEHDRRGLGRIRGAQRRGRREQCREALAGRRSLAGGWRGPRIMVGDRDPAQRRAVRLEQRREARLGDRADGAGRVGEHGEFRSGQLRVRGHADRAEMREREPDDQRLRTILEMRDDAIAGPDAAMGKPAGDARHGVREARIRPGFGGTLERGPDEKRVGRALASARCDEMGQVQTAEHSLHGASRK